MNALSLRRSSNDRREDRNLIPVTQFGLNPLGQMRDMAAINQQGNLWSDRSRPLIEDSLSELVSPSGEQMLQQVLEGPSFELSFDRGFASGELTEIQVCPYLDLHDLDAIFAQLHSEMI